MQQGRQHGIAKEIAGEVIGVIGAESLREACHALPIFGRVIVAWPIPAVKAARPKGHGSVTLLKKSWYFCPGVRGRASWLLVMLKAGMTPRTRWCSSCLRSCWPFEPISFLVSCED